MSRIKGRISGVGSVGYITNLHKLQQKRLQSPVVRVCGHAWGITWAAGEALGGGSPIWKGVLLRWPLVLPERCRSGRCSLRRLPQALSWGVITRSSGCQLRSRNRTLERHRVTCLKDSKCVRAMNLAIRTVDSRLKIPLLTTSSVRYKPLTAEMRRVPFFLSLNGNLRREASGPVLPYAKILCT